jgi:hypothetical protein
VIKGGKEPVFTGHCFQMKIGEEVYLDVEMLSKSEEEEDLLIGSGILEISNVEEE